jgi:hypothetical protein
MYLKMDSKPEPKKRGRKKKVVVDPPVPTKKKKSVFAKKVTDMNDIITNDNIHKKVNHILYLKCHIKDIDKYIVEQKWKTDNLNYDPRVPFDIVPYSDTNSFELINDPPLNSSTQYDILNANANICPKCSRVPTNTIANKANESLKEDEIEKIKELKLTFYKNVVPDKKVDCFWCTCPFDNDPFYILQHGSNKDVIGHGSFCTPECSVAYLFSNMNWDDSSKMESYSLINNFYNFSQSTNIKPACSPYYFLDKYYGNLSIQEFRKLSKSSNLMLCIEKPVTRILPEIHEDHDKNVNSSTTQVQQRGNYRVKKQSEKNNVVNKNDIIRDNFRGIGLSPNPIPV